MRRRTLFLHQIPIALAALLYVLIDLRPSPAPTWYWFAMVMCPVGTVSSYGYAAWLKYHEDRRYKRARSGLCPTCGYDLRASPGRCPECGAEQTPAATTPAPAVSAPAAPARPGTVE